MRNDEWLENLMYDIWENHFNDVPRLNTVIIKFGKRSIRQLGCITWLNNKTKRIDKLLSNQGPSDNPRITLINITSYFKDEFIPDYVVKATIAHELTHYTHGFNSPLDKRFNHPHKGGVVRKELMNRGLIDNYKSSQKWLKTNWKEYVISVLKLKKH